MEKKEEISKSISPAGKTSPLKNLMTISVIAVSYFLACNIGMLFPDSKAAFALIWPAAGISLAALLLNPKKLWPAILASIYTAGVAANLIGQKPLPNTLGFMTANVLEPLLGALVITSFSKKQTGFDNLRGITGLVVAAGVVNAATACIGAGTATLAFRADFFDFWSSWYIADGVGILIVTPMITSAAIGHTRRPDRGNLIMAEFTIVCIAWGFIIYLIFKTGMSDTAFADPYMAFIFMIFIAIRYGTFATTFAVFMLALGIFLPGTKLPDWGGEGTQLQAHHLLVFIASLAITGFSLAALIKERKIAQYSLREKNAEFERYFYTVSHDLKNPLRNIVSYLELLDTKGGKKISGELREFLTYAREGGDRMIEMLETLTKFAKIGKNAIQRSQFDCGPLISETSDDLKNLITGSGAAVMYDGLPVINADRVLVRELFQNLISNSIRYRSDAPPAIRITALKTGSMVEFCVSDNGRGISENSQHAVFDLSFKQDHEKGEHGTGFGLPICKKIVELHGGRIWVKPTPGNGTSVCFTLPAA